MDVKPQNGESEKGGIEIELFPLTNSEYIGRIHIEPVNISSVSSAVQTIIILDTSNSMLDQAARLTNKILPLFLKKLSYEEKNMIHLVTFGSKARLSGVTVARMRDFKILTSGATKLAPAIEVCETLFDSLDDSKPVRLLAISDGEVSDSKETEDAAAKLLEFITKRSFDVNSQAVRLFTSTDQPDTKSLCSVLQLNNTTKAQLVDVSATEDDDEIAEKMLKLFQDDHLNESQRLTSDSKILFKSPWETTSISKVMLKPGNNILWFKAKPSKALKLADKEVKICEQSELDLTKFQELMQEKVPLIAGYMKILKIIGSRKAKNATRKIFKYFEEKEKILSQKSGSDYSEGKITKLLRCIVNDENVVDFSSELKAKYLSQQVTLNESIKSGVLEENTEEAEITPEGKVEGKF